MVDIVFAELLVGPSAQMPLAELLLDLYLLLDQLDTIYLLEKLKKMIEPFLLCQSFPTNSSPSICLHRCKKKPRAQSSVSVSPGPGGGSGSAEDHFRSNLSPRFRLFRLFLTFSSFLSPFSM